MTDHLIDLEQARERLGVSRETVRRRIRRHKVKAALLGSGPGGKHLYRVADIDRLRDQMPDHAYAMPDQDRTGEPNDSGAPLSDQVSVQDSALTVQGEQVAIEAMRALVAQLAILQEREVRHEAERARLEAIIQDRTIAAEQTALTERERAIRAEAEAERLRAEVAALTPPPVPVPMPERPRGLFRWFRRPPASR